LAESASMVPTHLYLPGCAVRGASLGLLYLKPKKEVILVATLIKVDKGVL